MLSTENCMLPASCVAGYVDVACVVYNESIE